MVFSEFLLVEESFSEVFEELWVLFEGGFELDNFLE